ncbi:MAG: hypothetical protein DSM107014_06485 [Gomphosphaeria aponina SAG 52.96 = DSM 107014]|uniref:VWFA domain-containing protein n=1 Tax=Gomphosphaeria aponina SAG 52.96 = DSM 107014 TaxID=1521640 RepID=A0A941GNR3_9CHRO|nr:hypothetical protein [Gomphosphaeria aponina SAG 52.96 = DSM 107014]
MDILTEGGGLLLERDYSIIIDKSEIMLTENFTTDGERSFWNIVKEATFAIATKCEEFDFDGLTIYLYADNFDKFERVTVHQLADIFLTQKPSGKARLTLALKDAVEHYFQRRFQGLTKPNGETIVIITASEPEDEAAVKQTIIEASQQMIHEDELGITFIQVGTDKHLGKLLQTLDDHLVEIGAKFDICDTIKLENIDERTLSEVLLHAITN